MLGVLGLRGKTEPYHGSKKICLSRHVPLYQSKGSLYCGRNSQRGNRTVAASSVHRNLLFPACRLLLNRAQSELDPDAKTRSLGIKPPNRPSVALSCVPNMPLHPHGGDFNMEPCIPCARNRICHTETDAKFHCNRKKQSQTQPDLWRAVNHPTHKNKNSFSQK